MISERDIIYISKKQASLIVVVIATFGLLLFMLGYFWGKQSVLDEFNQRVTHDQRLSQDSLNESIDYGSAISSINEKSSLCDDQEAEGIKTDAVAALTLNNQSHKETDDVVAIVREQEEKNKGMEQGLTPSEGKKYSALLIGYGTKQAAMNFIHRLKSHSIETYLRPRISKTASGKIKRKWYQVITKTYSSKEELNREIERIKKYEHLKESDIKIIS
ncbi:hypothetical protein HYV11_00720 [Candidatus Dependentiae bacterium]|nr:hypothetical protein [Candidatus Dependentiae bacterium]